ncbi:MAG: GNAT family N-acetyltransferase [Clostridium sp.]|nr:GNAT family N-acetyltransferase [Clostridium sp.]
MNITFSQALPSDNPAITALDPLHREVDKVTDYTITRVEGELVAFAEVKSDFFGYPFVELLVVCEAYRWRGIGLALAEYLFENCKADRLFTSTNESNTTMRKLLDKAGFTQCGYCDALDEGDPELFYARRKSR